MPSFIVYEVASDAEKPFAFVPEAADARDALKRLDLAPHRFIARESHGASSGDVLAAQYRMRVRAVARRAR